MKLSLFRGGAADNTPIPLELSWPEWVAMFQKNGHTLIPNVGSDPASQKAAKALQPMFCPTEFSGSRKNENVVLVHMAVVDLDHAEPSLVAATVGKLEREGVEHLIYSGWSHSDTNLSCRVMMPLDSPVAGSDWPRFWLRLNTYFDGLADPQCKDAARPYFLPACPVERGKFAFVHHKPGRPLSVAAIRGLEVSPEVLTSSKVLRPVAREEIVGLCKKLRRENPPAAMALDKVLKGEPWAEPGFRDNVLFELAREIGKAFPKGDPATIAVVFEQSVSHFSDFSLADVQYKIRRKQEEIAQREEKKIEDAASGRQTQIRIALGPERDYPYTPDEIAAMAAKLGVTIEGLAKRWIIQRAGCVYVLCNGKYLGPWPVNDALLATHTFLAPATSAGVRLEELNVFGEFTRRSIKDLALDYGTPALKSVSDLEAQEAYFEADTMTMVEANAPLRPLTPLFNPDVDRWLRALGGEDYPLLEAWISWLTLLHLPCAALFVEGPPGCGKSLLAKGIARLWTTGAPTAMGQVLTGNFNQALEMCPLVFADEKLPKDFRGKGTTGELREFIQADVRPLSAKFRPDATLKGAARVIIAANNHSILEGEENLTPWDVEAIVARIVHIRVNDIGEDCAAALLYKLGSLGVTKNWVTEDVIARHCLHLIATVKRPENPPRFLVSQHKSPLHQQMTTSTVLGSACAHWLVGFLYSPERLRAFPVTDVATLCVVKDGQLLVSSRCMAEHWSLYKTNVKEDRATVRNIGKGLQALSTGFDKRRTFTKGPFNRQKLYVIKTDDLIEWAESNGFGTARDILTALGDLEEC